MTFDSFEKIIAKTLIFLVVISLFASLLASGLWISPTYAENGGADSSNEEQANPTDGEDIALDDEGAPTLGTEEDNSLAIEEDTTLVTDEEVSLITGEEISSTISYAKYLEQKSLASGHKFPDLPDLILTAEDFEGASGDFVLEEDHVLIKEEAYIELNFSASKGFYNMIIEYDPIPGRSRDMELGVRLDGKLPYKEAANLVLPRMWRDKLKDFDTDLNGNDIRPSQEEVLIDERSWLEYYASDSSGYQQESLIFELGSNNRLTILSNRENIKIHRIIFSSPKSLPTYEEYIKQYEGFAWSPMSADFIQAEHPTWKSDPTLVASSDRISPITMPNKGSKISLNMIGGNAWSIPGQKISWTLVPEVTGMYEIRLRSRQNYARGFYSTRSLAINGQIPFKEASNLRFTFSRNWEIYTISIGDETCKFYFEKGKEYSLSLEMVLGDFSDVLRRTSESMEVLNDIYRQLIMIMGSTPDTMRDYNLDKQIPGTIEAMQEQALLLDKIAEDIEDIAGFSGGELAAVRKVSDQLKEFYKDPRQIAKRLRFFKDNIALLNTWMLDAKNLPLDIDYIMVASPKDEDPRANANFFEKVSYAVKMFLASFFENYNLISSGGEGQESQLTVWSTSGRDQASILNDMVRSDYYTYSKESLGKSVGINLQIVLPDAILPSIAAGNGPDILMNAGMQLPVNYALRNAAVNIYELAPKEEVDEILTRFRPESMVPFYFNDGLYGLPEQQTYNLMFYRTDILSMLKIPEPSINEPWTWADIIKILPILQKKNMTFLMDTGTGANTDASLAMITFTMFLYQRGGNYYKEDGMFSDLDNEIAVEAFKYWTNFYTSYGLPTNFDIANRFRTGISPIVISNMTLYNQLMVSAPEIKGLWGMAPVPGTLKEDGTIDHSVRSISSAVMMLSSTVDRDAGWNYMKWWTSTDAQVTFSTEMESLLGTSARYPSANVEAMSLLPWSLRDYRVLEAQAEWAKGVEEVPGGYYTVRHINNAFRAVSVKEDGDEPRETILNYSRVINDEIFDKRSEFGLPMSKDQGSGK